MREGLVRGVAESSCVSPVSLLRLSVNRIEPKNMAQVPPPDREFPKGYKESKQCMI